jgi:hypothetical protein
MGQLEDIYQGEDIIIKYIETRTEIKNLISYNIKIIDF